MISAREPESGESLHPLIADKDILDSEPKCMSHMKDTGRVWRRHHDNERIFLCTIGKIIWIEKSAFLPLTVYPRFRRGWVVWLQEFLVYSFCRIREHCFKI